MAANIQTNTARSEPRPSVQRPSGLDICVEVNGCTYRGSYTVAGDIVTAYWGLRRRSLTTRGAPTRSVARKLLRELVRPLTAVDRP